MSKPLSFPEEPAPSYDELFSGHPTTTTAQSSRFGASRAYAAVPQNDSDGDDAVELANNSNHSNIDTVHDEESHMHTARIVDPTKPHQHCEECDRQLARREKHQAEGRCCKIVALTFIVAFICATVLGISIARANSH